MLNEGVDSKHTLPLHSMTSSSHAPYDVEVMPNCEEESAFARKYTVTCGQILSVGDEREHARERRVEFPMWRISESAAARRPLQRPDDSL